MLCFEKKITQMSPKCIGCQKALKVKSLILDYYFTQSEKSDSPFNFKVDL